MTFGQPFGSGQKAPNRGRADTNDDVVNIDGGAMDGRERAARCINTGHSTHTTFQGGGGSRRKHDLKSTSLFGVATDNPACRRPGSACARAAAE